MSKDRSKYDEIWVQTDDEQSMCALINGDSGWLMYLRYEGDGGFSSRNPKYAGPENATQEYYLSNGQMDHYPLSWALPIKEVRRALDFFRKMKKPPTWITWHNDSDDRDEIERKG